MRWIVQRGIFQGKEEENLVKELKVRGHKVHEIPTGGVPYNSIDCIDEELANHEPEPIVFRGSINLARYVSKHYKHWFPGAIFNANALRYSHYCAYLGPYLLNEGYYIFPYKELIRRKWELTARFFSPRVFLRPDSPYKDFHGDIYNLNDLKISPQPSPDSIVIVAPYQEIKKEYRFIVTPERIISGASYSKEYVCKSEKVKTTSKAWQFVDECLGYLRQQHWSPDDIYVMDITSVPGQADYRVVELNSFCSSAWYNNDIGAVVNAVSELAEKQFEEMVA